LIPHTSPRRQLSLRLNVFPPLRWLFDLHPVWVAVVCMAISPGVMWLNDILLVHGRFIPLQQQWLSALFDIALAIAAAVMVAVARSAGTAELPHWVRNRVFHALLLLGGCYLSISHMWQARGSVTTWERRLGPNSLYHNILLYPFLGYLLGLLFVTTFVFYLTHGYKRSRYLAAYVFVLALTGAWAAAGIYDGDHQFAPGGIPKASIANPSDPWCGGLLTRPLCGPPER